MIDASEVRQIADQAVVDGTRKLAEELRELRDELAQERIDRGRDDDELRESIRHVERAVDS